MRSCGAHLNVQTTTLTGTVVLCRTVGCGSLARASSALSAKCEESVQLRRRQGTVGIRGGNHHLGEDRDFGEELVVLQRYVEGVSGLGHRVPHAVVNWARAACSTNIWSLSGYSSTQSLTTRATAVG